MRTSFVLSLGILCLGLGQVQADNIKVVGKAKTKPFVVPYEDGVNTKGNPSPFRVPLSDKVRVPAPNLSVDQIYVSTAPHALTTTLTVTGVYHNYTFKTITGATYSIDSLYGTTWSSIKNGSLPPIAANEVGYARVELTLNNSLSKFRFRVTPSVEDPKEYRIKYWTVLWRCEQQQFDNFGSTVINDQNYLNALGFQTTLNPNVGGIYYQAPGWREWAFASLADAQRFQTNLPKKGVESSIQER